ncbi:MAG TPA: ATP-grasp domain-containing protein [Algoriphagus sp.]|nr:ATP-grasp domain-containing protein [Algoriphagus sp.]
MILNKNPGRIIGMPTSEVYLDQKLIPNLLQIPKNHLDNGIQAQLYLKQEDILVVHVPHITANLAEILLENLKINSFIWKELTGISINPKEVVVSYTSKDESILSGKNRIISREGSLLSTSIQVMRQSGKSILGFIFSSGFLEELELKKPVAAELKQQSKATDFFMDKNLAMTFFSKSEIKIPLTYPFERKSFSISMLDKLGNGEYILKPSGGAAGLGLYPKGGIGAPISELREHLKNLESSGLLPERFQIQEFVPGKVWGIMGLILPGRQWKVLQIHTQQMDHQGRFIGGRWTSSFESGKIKFAEELFSRLVNQEGFDYLGLIQFDLIGDKIIEVNPRITASSPICHLLSLESKIQAHRGKEFHFRQIDINTQIQFPETPDKLRQAAQLIQKTQNESGFLILPQGINPLGKSRVVFVNDKEDLRFQNKFLEELENL